MDELGVTYEVWGWTYSSPIHPYKTWTKLQHVYTVEEAFAVRAKHWSYRATPTEKDHRNPEIIKITREKL